MKISSLIAGILVVLAVLAGLVFLSGNSLLMYTDVLSLLAILALSLPLLIAVHGWKGFWRSWGLSFRSVPGCRKDLSVAAEVVRNTRRMLYLAAGLAAFLGFIGTLVRIDGDVRIASRTVNYAVSLLSFFYALILDLIIVTPTAGCLARRIAGTTDET